MQFITQLYNYKNWIVSIKLARQQGVVVTRMRILKKLFLFIKEIRSQKLKITVNEDKTSGLISMSIVFPYKSTPPIFKDPLDLLKESYPKVVFSEEDFSTILDSILENQKRIIEKKHKKECSIIKHQFSDQLDEPLVVYNEVGTNKIYIKPAREIYLNVKQLDRFNSNDSACIGNIVGCSETERDYKIRSKKTNKNNVIKFDKLS